jgi:hypothetical protein
VLSDGKVRTRGYSRVDVDARTLRRAWRANGVAGSAPISKEFVVGYRLATARGKLDDFCRWSKMETELSFNPMPRRWLAGKLRGEDAYRTRAPVSPRAERAMGIPLLERDRLTDFEEDGCPEGFIRD